MINTSQEIPPDIEALLNIVIRNLKKLLESKLIGVYLHGSLAMGCYNPKSSDVDLLIVVSETLSTATKKAIAKSLLSTSEKLPKNAIELSIVTLDAVQQFQYPPPYEFHFSDAWKARYIADAVNLEDQKFDPDLAAHFMVTIRRGACLYGRPIREVFREIPEQYFRNSILNDAHDILADIGQNPVYGVLNLCRMLAYVTEKQVTSKAEGGDWGLKHVDPQYASLIKEALDEYRNQSPTRTSWDKIELDKFAAYVRQRLAPNTAVSPTGV